MALDPYLLSLAGLEEMDPLAKQRALLANMRPSSSGATASWGDPEPQPPAPAQPPVRQTSSAPPPQSKGLTTIPTSGVESPDAGPTYGAAGVEQLMAGRSPAEQAAIRAAGSGRKTNLSVTPEGGLEPGHGDESAPRESDPNETTFKKVMAEIERIRGERPDADALVRYAGERQNKSNRNFALGLTLQALGGQSLAPAGGHILQQALKESGDYEIPGGYGTVTDKGVVWNPEKQREQSLKALEFQAGQLRQEQQHQATLAANEVAKRRHDEIIAAQLANKQGQAPKLTQAGTTPDGRLVNYDGTTGQRIVTNADGTREVYDGPVLSQSHLDKQAEKIQTALHQADTGRSLLDMVKAHPKAFGGIAALAPYTGSFASSRILAANLTPEEQQTRAMVLTEAAQLVHDLYGAAVAAREDVRASGFVYNQSDPPEVLMPKLMAAIQYAEQKSKEFGTGVRSTAVRRQGGDAPDSGPPPNAVRLKVK